MSGLSYARLRNAVRRDSFSDYLPLVAWEEETEAFLCIDDTWGHAWELVPTAYMFAHVQGALQGLLNIHFPDGTVLQLHTFADPLIDDALDGTRDGSCGPAARWKGGMGHRRDAHRGQ